MDKSFLQDHGLPRPASRFQQWCGAVMCAGAAAAMIVFFLPLLLEAVWDALGLGWRFLGFIWAGRNVALSDWRTYAAAVVFLGVLFWWHRLESDLATHDRKVREAREAHLRQLREADPDYLPVGNYWVVSAKVPDDQPQIVYWDGNNFSAMGSPHLIPRSTYRIVSANIPAPRRLT